MIGVVHAIGLWGLMSQPCHLGRPPVSRLSAPISVAARRRVSQQAVARHEPRSLLAHVPLLAQYTCTWIRPDPHAPLAIPGGGQGCAPPSRPLLPPDDIPSEIQYGIITPVPQTTIQRPTYTFYPYSSMAASERALLFSFSFLKELF